MIIDCMTCPVQGSACAGCSVRVVLDSPVRGLPLDPSERRAVQALVGGGLISPGQAEGLRADVEPWMDVQAVG